MWPDQRRKALCNYYSSSDFSCSRRVCSYTSRRQPSSTSSDLDTQLSFPVARATAASDTVHLATLDRLFDQGSVWRSPSLIWSAFFLGKPQLCVVATLASARRQLQTGPEFENFKGSAPSPRFPNFCRSALAWVSPYPPSTTLEIFQAAVAPTAIRSPNTLSAESFAVTCGWPM